MTRPWISDKYSRRSKLSKETHAKLRRELEDRNVLKPEVEREPTLIECLEGRHPWWTDR